MKKEVTPEEKEELIARARWYKRFFFYKKLGKAITVVLVSVTLPYPLGVLWRIVEYLFKLGYRLF